MAGFVLASNVLHPAQDESSKALLFFCKQFVAGEEDDLKRRYEAISQEVSQNPVFVLERSQTFEHDHTRTGEDLHCRVGQHMLAELLLFLPPELPVSLIKEHAQELVDVSQNDRRSATYMQYVVQAPSGQPQSQHLEACFLNLPSCDTLEVHYVSLNVCPKPKSKLSSNRDETLKIDGMRSTMKFSMISSIATQVVSQQERDVTKETIQFLQDTERYNSSTQNVGDSNDARLSLSSATQPTDYGNGGGSPEQKSGASPRSYFQELSKKAKEACSDNRIVRFFSGNSKKSKEDRSQQPKPPRDDSSVDPPDKAEEESTEMNELTQTD